MLTLERNVSFIECANEGFAVENGVGEGRVARTSGSSHDIDTVHLIHGLYGLTERMCKQEQCRVKLKCGADDLLLAICEIGGWRQFSRRRWLIQNR